MADDLLQGLRDVMGGQNPDPNEEMDEKATMEYFLKALENTPGLGEQERENIIKSLSSMGGPEVPLQDALANLWVEIVILLCLATLIACILGFIGYKLFSTIRARERRKELKKQKKDQKKDK